MRALLLLLLTAAFAFVIVDYEKTYTIPQTVFPGDDFTLMLRLTASSKIDRLKVTPISPEGETIEIEEILSGQSIFVPIKFKAPEKSGFFPIRIKLEYLGPEGEGEREIEVKIPITPIGEPKIAPLVEVLAPGDQNVCFKLSSPYLLRNAEIAVSSENARISQSLLFLGDVERKIFCTHVEPTGRTATISLSLSYFNPLNEKEARTYVFTFPVESKGPEVRIIEAPVLPGEKTEIGVVVEGKGLKDVWVHLDSNFLRPFGATSVFLGDVNGERIVRFSLLAPRDLEPGAYPIAITVSHSAGQKTFFAGIEVRGTTTLEIEKEADLFEEKAGILVINRGRETARGVFVRVFRGDEQILAYFIGDLDSEDYETIEVPLEDSACVKVVVTHEKGSVEKELCFEKKKKPANPPYWLVLLLIPAGWFAWKRLRSSK